MNVKQEILRVMRVWEDFAFPPTWYGYDSLCQELENKYTIKELKQAMKELCADGTVILASLYDERKSRFAGRGWFVRRSK